MDIEQRGDEKLGGISRTQKNNVGGEYHGLIK